MKMIFVGEDNSLGYRKGQIYDVEIKIVDNKLILFCKGHLQCPYQSVEALLRNWKK